MQDIADEIGHAQVAAVVDDFYNRIQSHPSLAMPFAVVHDWVAHKEILTHFWWVTLGGERYLDYSYRVAWKHEEAGFTPALLVDWLFLFRDIIRDHITDEHLANGWIERAERIGESLTYMHEVAQRGGMARASSGLFKPA